MHYYQHHIGDFIKDTANLNDHQLSTYMRMVWTYYSEEKPFANEPEDIAFAMRSDEKTVCLILRHYFKETADGWRHSRCDREIAEFHGKKEKASASANARWINAKNKANAKQTQSDRNANASKTDANQEPITNNQEEDQKPSVADATPAPATSKTRGTRLPDDWTLPADWAAWAIETRPEFSAAAVAAMGETFADYWRAKAGSAAIKLDWLATWRNWVRNQKSPGQPFGTPPAPSRHHGFDNRNYSDGLEVREDGTNGF